MVHSLETCILEVETCFQGLVHRAWHRLVSVLSVWIYAPKTGEKASQVQHSKELKETRFLLPALTLVLLCYALVSVPPSRGQ